MRIKNWLFLFMVVWPGWTYSQVAPTLRELIESAMASDEKLNQQVLQNRVTQLDDERLKDVFLPKIDLSGKAGYLQASALFKMPGITLPAAPQIGFPGITVAERNNKLEVSGISSLAKAEASMLIYSGGKVKYLKEANKEKGLAEQQLMKTTKDELMTEISRAYDQFALLSESKKVLDEGKKRLEINRKTADKALGYGLITPAEHQKIELAQALLDSKMVEYEGKRSLLITQLHLLTGIDRDRISMIEPVLQPIHYLSTENDVSERAEIQALQHGMNAADYKIKAEKTWWIPKIQAQTSFTYLGLYQNHLSTSKELFPASGYRLNVHPSNLNILPVFQAGVGFKWDLFDGREGKTNVHEAKIRKDILLSQQRDAEKKLKLNLANNQTHYQIADVQIVMKRKARDIAAKVLQNVEKEFRYGTKKSSDLIDAENDFINADLEYQTAVFNQRRTAVELMKSTQNLSVDKLY